MPYNVSQLPQHAGGKSFVGTRTGMRGMATSKVTTSSFASVTVQRADQQASTAAASSSTLGSTSGPSNLGGTLSIPGERADDRPPSYREAFGPR